jgi:hypothetical protein
MSRRAKTVVTMMTTNIVLVGTQPVASLHQRSTIKGMEGTTMTCATSSAVEMHAAGLKTSAEIRSMTSRSSAMRGTMTIMIPSMTNLTDSILHTGDTFQEVSRLIPEI